jgi:hypothetical protein
MAQFSCKKNETALDMKKVGNDVWYALSTLTPTTNLFRAAHVVLPLLKAGLLYKDTVDTKDMNEPELKANTARIEKATKAHVEKANKDTFSTYCDETVLFSLTRKDFIEYLDAILKSETAYNALMDGWYKVRPIKTSDFKGFKNAMPSKGKGKDTDNSPLESL